MLALIAVWALAEAVLFFIVADVPIMALGIRSGVKKALIGAGIAAVFAALGGLILAYYSGLWPKDVYPVLIAVPAIDEALVAQVEADWDARGALGMMIGSFSGVPYKLYAFAAGLAGERSLLWFGWFVLVSILARLPRFVLVALVSGWAGPRLVARFGARAVWAGFGVAWAAFYAWYWSVMGY